jgi:DNA protecting protein DprA
MDDSPGGHQGAEVAAPVTVGSEDRVDAGSPMTVDSVKVAPEKTIGPLFPEPREGAHRRESVPFDVSLLALSGIKGLGLRGLRALVEAFEGELGRVWHADPVLLRDILVKAKVRASDRMTSEILRMAPVLLSRGQEKAAELSGKGVRVIPARELPAPLREILDPPGWLFVQGNARALYHRPAVAVVGTRKPSSQGRRAATIVAKILAAYPITLISGLAEGVDEEAHRASLQEGVVNVAFLGHGIGIVFPASTAPLREMILEKGGAVATEYLPHEHYRRTTFVERNRLQAALADMVVPIESGPKGGTVHTIRFARRYGRKVLAVRWRGANGLVEELIRDGAPVVDVLTSSGWKHLDQIFQQLAQQAGHEVFPLSLVEKRLRSEIRSRNVKPGELERLITLLSQWARELEGEGNS